jgi:hypothetical protein
MPLKITFGSNEITDYLRIDSGLDNEIIDTLVEGSMSEAERFLNTDFGLTIVNPDGTTSTIANEAPIDVKIWVLDRIVERYENRGRAPKPDFSTLKQHRELPFKGAADLKPVVEE